MSEYAIYLRKSRADLELEAHGELETLARHEKQLLEVASKMKISITSIYKEVVSGETIDARPVVQKLLSEVEDGKWTGVLVMEVERLARGDTIDQGIVSRAFKLSGAKIITPITNEIDRLSKESDNAKSTIPEMEKALVIYPECNASQKNELLRKVVRRIEYEKNERNSRSTRETYNFTLDVTLKL